MENERSQLNEIDCIHHAVIVDDFDLFSFIYSSFTLFPSAALLGIGVFLRYCVDIW